VDENVFDETWFVDTDVEEAMRRIIQRHVAVGRSEEEARMRAESNDALNARLVVQQCRTLADVLIPCVSFER
jgi:pantothenate kinase